MKCFKGIGRSLGIASLLFIGCAIDVLPSQRVALAQPIYPKAVDSNDLLCYMQTTNGQIVNLNKWCGRKPGNSPASFLSGNDQQFLQGYQSFLGKRAKTSPSLQALLSESQKSPQAIVERAKGVCTGTGPTQRTSDPGTDYLFQAMALKRYCAGRDD